MKMVALRKTLGKGAVSTNIQPHSKLTFVQLLRQLEEDDHA
jgi:hypothetical protein